VPIFVRISEVGPIATAFYRFFLSFPFLMAWMIYDQAKTPSSKMPASPREYMLLLGAGVFLAIDITLWHWSIVYTSVINATLLNNLTTIFVALGSFLFLKHSISSATKKGIGLALIGSIILVGHNFKFSGDGLFGDILALLSAIFFTGFIIIVKELRHFFRSPTILAWGAMPTIYIFATVAYFSGEKLLPDSTMGWLPLIGLAFFVHILGQGLLTYSMAHISATLSSLVIGMSPIFAALFAWLILNETLTWLQALGAFIALLGVYTAKRGEIR
jgi:drug/metabolite transporter (DMT)-like permease